MDFVPSRLSNIQIVKNTSVWQVANPSPIGNTVFYEYDATVLCTYKETAVRIYGERQSSKLVLLLTRVKKHHVKVPIVTQTGIHRSSHQISTYFFTNSASLYKDNPDFPNTLHL